MHIAPCGMNCSLCSAYQRQKNHCPGCNSPDAEKPSSYCTTCRISHCEELKRAGAGFCYACTKFPCQRLKQLDKRYRTKYGMSMLENQQVIAAQGLEGLLAREKERWTCRACGVLLCVHKGQCLGCGAKNERYIGSGVQGQAGAKGEGV